MSFDELKRGRVRIACRVVELKRRKLEVVGTVWLHPQATI
jgi:hypothetical protein